MKAIAKMFQAAADPSQIKDVDVDIEDSMEKWGEDKMMRMRQWSWWWRVVDKRMVRLEK